MSHVTAPSHYKDSEQDKSRKRLHPLAPWVGPGDPPLFSRFFCSGLTTLLAKFTVGIGMVAFSPSFQFQDKKHSIYFQERRSVRKDVGF